MTAEARAELQRLKHKLRFDLRVARHELQTDRVRGTIEALQLALNEIDIRLGLAKIDARRLARRQT